MCPPGRNITFFILTLTIAIASGCRKNSNDEKPGSSPDIYVAGYEHNDATGRTSIAKIWKNGVSTDLTDGKSFAQPTSIFVSGNDVYVAGSDIKAGVNVARIWKNGVAIDLPGGSSHAYARSVFVDGPDVYVSGGVDDGIKFVPTVWKNGILMGLSHGSGNSDVSDILVTKGDIYVAGAEYNGSPATNGGKLWKNGIDTILSKSGKVTGVTLVENDIVVSGYYNNKAAVWRNYKPDSIQTNLYYSSTADAIHAVNKNVYVAGSGATPTGEWFAVVWQNGIPINLSDGTHRAYAVSVCADSSSYYAVGHEYINGKHVAKFWSKGVNKNLTDGKRNGYAMAVFVK